MISSAIFFVIPITFTGATALSVETKTNRFDSVLEAFFSATDPGSPPLFVLRLRRGCSPSGNMVCKPPHENQLGPVGPHHFVHFDLVEDIPDHRRDEGGGGLV